MLFKNKNDVKVFLQEYIHKMDQCTDDAYKCDHNTLVNDIKMFAESKDEILLNCSACPFKGDDCPSHDECMEEKLFEDCNCSTCDPERNNCNHRDEVG